MASITPATAEALQYTGKAAQTVVANLKAHTTQSVIYDDQGNKHSVVFKNDQNQAVARAYYNRNGDLESILTKKDATVTMTFTNRKTGEVFGSEKALITEIIVAFTGLNKARIVKVDEDVNVLSNTSQELQFNQLRELASEGRFTKLTTSDINQYIKSSENTPFAVTERSDAEQADRAAQLKADAQAAKQRHNENIQKLDQRIDSNRQNFQQKNQQLRNKELSKQAGLAR